MAKLNVSPTRMVLSDLKRRRSTAVRGHKLLKDKQDELMRQFIQNIRTNMQLRQALENELTEAFRDFMLARAVMSPEMLEQAVSFPQIRLMVDIQKINCMSVRVPRMHFVRLDADGNPLPAAGEALRAGAAGGSDAAVALPYGFMQTSAELDAALERLSRVMEQLLELAEIEKTCQLMADDIESTRRRVNALEYRTIPDLAETIKFIRMKLEENERATNTRLMKVKELIAPDA